MSENPIRDMVLRAREGDREAYGELAERFQSTVYGVALARLRNHTEAQELTQDVLLHGMQKLSQLRDVEAFPGWLRQITVRMAINRVQRVKPLHPTEQEVLESAEAVTTNPLEEMVKAEQRDELWVALRKLKAIDRKTLVAFYLRDLSLKEMAAEDEVPVGTIKRRLHVARNRLKLMLEQAARERDENGPALQQEDNEEECELICS